MYSEKKDDAYEAKRLEAEEEGSTFRGFLVSLLIFVLLVCVIGFGGHLLLGVSFGMAVFYTLIGFILVFAFAVM